MKGITRYRHDIVAFIDELVTYNELGRPFALHAHQRTILPAAFQFDHTGRLAFDTFVYACPKKSGKTTLNALITLWWAFTQDPPNELYVVANDLEQAQARVFKAMVGLITYNRALTRSATVQSRQLSLSNGTVITAIASEYAGAAGSNHGCTSWDELWGYTTEPLHRLWEELTPVPTRTNSIRVITTYAGFEGESDLLWGLYRQGVDAGEHPDGQGQCLDLDVPVYTNREARLFVYWDHEPRMPWQTPEYYATQRRTLRPETFLRQHENRWTSASNRFITAEMWDRCVTPALRPTLPSREHELFVGVDVGIRHDSAAVVAVYRDGNRLILALHRIWTPSPAAPLDLEATIETYLRDLHDRYRVASILCDPYQCHRSIMTLQRAGLPVTECPQTTATTTRMGQTLFEMLSGRTLHLYVSDELRAQALHTVAVETPRGWRIAKEKAAHKIDAIVALTLASVAAIDTPVRQPPSFFTFGPTPDDDWDSLRPGEEYLS